MIVFHGTTDRQRDRILKAGFFKAGTYFSTSRQEAIEYVAIRASHGTVFRVRVNRDWLEHDPEFMNPRIRYGTEISGRQYYSNRPIAIRNITAEYRVQFEKWVKPS